MHSIVRDAIPFPLLPPLAAEPLRATPVTNAILYPRQELSLLASPSIIPNCRYIPTRANYSLSFLRGVRTGTFLLVRHSIPISRKRGIDGFRCEFTARVAGCASPLDRHTHCGVWVVQAPAGRSHMAGPVMSPILRERGQMQAPVPSFLAAPNQTAGFTTRSGIRGGQREDP
jgi:hypothetical protein